ncbi:MAG: DEAD/DEAH box helicase [Thaumarchaeota archaeon]|nr:DEAD/DEAH box helicase [Nitrososphaerota archaeon]
MEAAELIQRLEKVTGNTYSDDQKTAISHGKGPLWITAGPGSGKTEVLVARTLKLILCDEIKPESIILTTFTERASKSLLNRVSSYVDDLGIDVDATSIRTGTLHSICNSVMRDFRYPDYIDLELLDENSRPFFLYNQDPIIEYFQERWQRYQPLFKYGVNPAYGPNKWLATDAAGYLFDRVTEFRVDVDKMGESDDPAASGLARIYKQYRQGLRQSYRSDLSVLQEYFLQFLGTAHGKQFLGGDEERDIAPVEYLLVDEFQDTNPIQEDIYFLIAKAIGNNITVVGDDDQALYRFRGGTVDSLVSFGDRCRKELGVEPKTVNLNENLRSHPGIVDWINNYISSEKVMQQKGARAPDKREMVAKGPVKGDYPPVCAILGRRAEDAAERLGDFLLSLKRDKLITDWRDVGILFRSTREGPRNAGPYVDALRARSIPIYNPRNRALHEDPVIQQIFGALVVTLDRDLVAYGSISGRVKDMADDWIGAYQALARMPQAKQLAEYVKESQQSIAKLPIKEVLGITLMDVFYRILSLPPFTDLKSDPNYATRFAEITDLLDAFSAFTLQYGVLRSSSSAEGLISFRFLQSLYREFTGFIDTYGLNDPEDEEEVMPAGYVQVMTVHQAKGLQFPVVVVDNLGDTPKSGSDHWTEDFLASWSRRKPFGTAQARAEQDFVRRYYVAYSRARNLLILCGRQNSTTSWVLGE